MKLISRALLSTGLVVLGAGCSGDSGGEEPSQDASGALAFQAQVERGMSLYTEHCATCHGDSGQGTADGPAVVGEDVLPRSPESREVRDVEFVTAMDVFLWISKNMPADDPGSLETSEYVDVLAFALAANGVELDEPLSATNADAIVLNP